MPGKEGVLQRLTTALSTEWVCANSHLQNLLIYMLCMYCTCMHPSPLHTHTHTHTVLRLNKLFTFKSCFFFLLFIVFFILGLYPRHQLHWFQQPAIRLQREWREVWVKLSLCVTGKRVVFDLRISNLYFFSLRSRLLSGECGQYSIIKCPYLDTHGLYSKAGFTIQR